MEITTDTEDIAPVKSTNSDKLFITSMEPGPSTSKKTSQSIKKMTKESYKSYCSWPKSIGHLQTSAKYRLQ